MELSLEDYSTFPVLLHMLPNGPHGQEEEYYYFDSDNYTYNIDVDDNELNAPNVRYEGFFEISEDEFHERMDTYISSLTYLGEIKLEHLGQYESDPSRFSNEPEAIEILNREIERDGSWEFIIEADDSKEDVYEKYQHAIANAAYQAYISALPESTDSTDDAIVPALRYVEFFYCQYNSDKPYNFERTYTLSGSSLDIEITSLIYISGKNEEIVTTEGKLTARQWQDFFALESTQAAFHGTSRYPNPELEYEPEGWLTVGGNRYYDPHLENSPDYLKEIVNEIEKMAEETGVAEKHELAIEVILE